MLDVTCNISCADNTSCADNRSCLLLFTYCTGFILTSVDLYVDDLCRDLINRYLQNNKLDGKVPDDLLNRPGLQIE